jgi:hypothetical protein
MQLLNRYHLAFVSFLMLLFLHAGWASASPMVQGVTASSLWCPWPKDSVHSPKKAAILSAILPGAGQAYNRKYWKIPLVYAAGGAGVYFISTNHRDYQIFKQAYIYRNDDDPNTIDDFPFATSQRLKVYRDYYRRNMELSVILTAAVYMLQILDATVDAHLYEFDVSNNLSMKIQPALLPVFQTASVAPGMQVSLKFGRNNHETRTKEALRNPSSLLGLHLR